MVYSATAPLDFEALVPEHFRRHAGAALVAFGVAALCVRIPLGLWERYATVLWGAVVVLLGLTLAFGARVNGATRWLVIPGVGPFQPGELAKLATLLAVASVLAGREARSGFSPAQLQRIAFLTLIPAALLLAQPDFGTTVVLVALVGLLLFAAGAPLGRLWLPTGIGALGAALYIAVNPYALRRVTGFLDPWAQSKNEGYQLVQSFVAFGRGGLQGVGLGHGRQKLGFLPEAHTDFILSVIAEELGALGVVAVIGTFAALALGGLRIAQRARDPFAALVALGMTGMIAVPAAINSAVVMGLLPTKGFALPFLSYGRSALLVTAIAIGLLLRAGLTRENSARAPNSGRALRADAA
jgi:cell division protein FtsW